MICTERVNLDMLYLYVCCLYLNLMIGFDKNHIIIPSFQSSIQPPASLYLIFNKSPTNLKKVAFSVLILYIFRFGAH